MESALIPTANSQCPGRKAPSRPAQRVSLPPFPSSREAVRCADIAAESGNRRSCSPTGRHSVGPGSPAEAGRVSQVVRRGPHLRMLSQCGILALLPCVPTLAPKPAVGTRLTLASASEFHQQVRGCGAVVAVCMWPPSVTGAHAQAQAGCLPLFTAGREAEMQLPLLSQYNDFPLILCEVLKLYPQLLSQLPGLRGIGAGTKV